MLRRLFASLLAALALVTAAGCTDDATTAARIGELTISHDELLDELDEWIGNPAAQASQAVRSSAPGTLPLELVTQLLGQRIRFELHNAEFEALGLELDDGMRDDGLTAGFGSSAAAEQPLSGFSDEYRARYVDDLARQIAVQTELGDDYTDWTREALRNVDVEVSPRYGSWDPVRAQVLPPAGPSRPVGAGSGG